MYFLEFFHKRYQLEENLGELYILCQYDNYGLKCSFVLKNV